MSSLRKTISAVRSLFDNLQGTNIWLILLLLFLYQLTFGYLRMEFIATDALYGQHIESQLTNKYGDLMDEFEDDIEDFDDYEDETIFENIIDQGISGIFLVLNIGFLTLVFLVGFSFQTENVSFSSLFKAITISNFIFFFPKVLEFVWFVVIQTDYSFTDVQEFKPFSLYNLFPQDSISAWMEFPLKKLNVFEFLYVILISIGISQYAKIKLNKTFAIVSMTYSILLITIFIIRIYFSSVFNIL